MNNKAHFSYCLQKYPDSVRYLQIICKAWKKYGRIPAKLVLQSGASFIEPRLSELFGPGALHLSQKGAVSLLTGKLFDNISQETKEQWIRDIHEAAGIQFTVKESGENLSASYNAAVQKWNLMFPQLAALSPLLSRSQNRTTQEQLGFWISAARIVTFLLKNTEALTVSDLGARFCADSKALRGGELITTVANWLVFIDTGIQLSMCEFDNEVKRDLRRQSLESHGIVENRCTLSVAVFGPLVFFKDGRRVDYVKTMWSMGNAALLSLDNLENVQDIELPEHCPVYLCENESPFAHLARRNHPGVAIYTKGFPNAAVCKLYKLIATRYPGNKRFHWGDTDLAGLRIASIFHGIAPLKLWRCGLDDLKRHKDGLIGVENAEKERIRMFLENNPEFPFRDNLLFTCEYGWLEQERFERESDGGE